jgi:hypothetical protein
MIFIKAIVSLLLNHPLKDAHIRYVVSPPEKSAGLVPTNSLAVQ